MSDVPTDYKWRGTPLSRLEVKELRTAFTATTEILRAIIFELARRGHWVR